MTPNTEPLNGFRLGFEKAQPASTTSTTVPYRVGMASSEPVHVIREAIFAIAGELSGEQRRGPIGDRALFRELVTKHGISESDCDMRLRAHDEVREAVSV